MSCLLIAPVQADDLVWDAVTGTTGAQDGAGTWTLGQPNWFNQTSTTDNVSWVNGNNAIFGAGSGAAGTVTLGGPITVGDLTFNAPGSGSYIITGDTLTLGSGLVVVNSSATISSILAGTSGLATSGAGQLTLSGSAANTYTGLTTVTGGRLHLFKTAGINSITGDLDISGGADVTFGAGDQIADTAAITMSGVGSVFNGTGPNAGTLTGINETFAELQITGGTFNSSSGSNWNIGTVSFLAGENKTFVGNSSSKQTFGSLTLVGMNGAASSTAVANGFTIFGNGGSFVNRTILTVGAGGLSLDGSIIHMSLGSSGNEMILNGDVTTTGTSASSITREGSGLFAYVSLSGGTGTVSRTFDIGSGADLTVAPIITNGTATTASIIKNGAGSLILSGSEDNTFDGGVTINAGTLRLNKTAGITAVNGNITVNSGGVLQLSTNEQIADTAGITLDGGTMTGWGTDETIAFFTQNAGGLASGGNVGHVTISGALTLAGGNTLIINSNAGSANPASWNVGSAILSGADILIGGTNGAANPRTSLTIGAGGLTMLGRTITMNVGDAGVILNLNGDFTGLGTNNIVANSSASVQPLLEIGVASRGFNVLGGTTTIGVEISGAGGSLVKTGNGLLQVTTANSYSGITTASGGTFSVAGAGGMLTGTTAIIANNGATLQDGSSNAPNNDGVSNRINPAATLTLGSATGGGTFNLMTASTTTHTQDLDSLTISGSANAINVTAAASTTSTLTFTSANPYVRTAGSIDFTQNPATGGSIIFTNAPTGAGNVSSGLLLGATLNGTDLILAQSGVLTAFTGWIPTSTDTWTTGGAMDVTGTNAVPYSATNINALRFNTAGPFIVTLAGTHTVDLDVILMTPNAGAGGSVVTGGTLQGTSGGVLNVSQFNTTGTLEIASTIADNTSATGFAKSGGGVLLLSGTNTYTGITRVSEGVLRAADGTGLPTSSALLIDGGVFESTAATFSRALGTAAGEVSLVGGVSGFSASGTAVTVNLGGAGATIQWGGTNFDPATLLLNASTATAALNFVNGIDLNGSTRSIRVDAGTVTISGVISNSAVGSPAGFIKTGGGTLVLSQSNTFDGAATVSGGTLRLTQANAITGGVTVTSGTLAVGDNAALGSADITLSGGTLQADGAARTLANNVLVTSSSTLGGSQTLTLNGVISGSSTLNKSSTSVVELTGNNTFTGTLAISAGIIRVLSNNALGSTTGGTTVSGNSQVELGDGVVITGETITVSSTQGTTGDGSPTVNRGGLQASVNATAEWAGSVIVGTNLARIGVQEGGTLTISGNITDGANNFSLRLSGELSGTGGLIISGTGNAWDGQTEIVRGKVFLGAHDTLPTTTVLDIHFTGSNNNEYAGLDMNGFNQTLRSLLNEGITGSNAEMTNSSATLSTLTINETGTSTFEGIITGNLALTKTGAGEVTLAPVTGSNTYTGGTTVNEGALRLGNANASPAGDLTVNGGTSAGGTFDLNDQNATFSTLNGAAGTVSGIITNNSTTAAVRTLTVGANDASSSYAGAMVDNSGGGALGMVALTKIGTGTLILTGVSTHSGGINVNAGTLLWSGSNDLPVAGALAVNAGGNFSLADGIARDTSTAALNLADGASLTFDWNAGFLDKLTSTAAATATGNVTILINYNGPTGAGGTLISSANGGLTSGGGNYFLVNNTNFTAALTQSDTAVSIGALTSATALTDAYWLGGQLPSAPGAMSLSTGATSNWASDAAGTSAGGLVPGGTTVNVIFSATSATEQGNVSTNVDLDLGSITFNDSTSVTIAGNNTITLHSTSSTAATSFGSGTNVTPGSAITVTSFANVSNTIGANVVLGATQTWNIASGKTLNVSGTVTGGAGLTQAGAGTLVLSGSNTYTGNTIIGTGSTLQIGTGGGSGTLGNGDVVNDGALVFDRTGTFTVANIVSGSGTLKQSGTVATTFTGVHTYTGDTTVLGGTLTIASGSSIGVAGATAGSLQIGESSTGAVVVEAGGELRVGSGSSSSLLVGARTTLSGTTVGTLNMAAASSFTADVGLFQVGGSTFTSQSGATGTALGTVTLAHDNTITASTGIVVAEMKPAVSNTPVTSNLTFGAGTSNVTTPSVLVGGSRSTGTITIASGGTLHLDNGAGNTNLTIGQNIVGGTGTHAVGIMDLTGGTFVATLDKLILGDKDLAGGTGVGTATGTLTLGATANAVTANSVIISNQVSSASSSTNTTRGTLNFGGGTFTVANDVGVGIFAAGGNSSGTFNLTGGTFTVGGNITSSNDAKSNAVVMLDGATLDMTGGSIDANTFDVRSGALKDVSQIFNGGGTVTADLTKTTTGTLSLIGTNTYSGATVVTDGALEVRGTTGTGAVTAQTGSTIFGTGVIQGTTFTLDDSATLRPGDSVADGSHGTLTFTPASASGSTSSLQGTIVLGITGATVTDATYGGNVLGSAGYDAWVDSISGTGNHDRLVFNDPTTGSGYSLDFLTTTGSLQIVGDAFTPQQGMAFNLLDWGSLVTANFTGFTFSGGYLVGNGDEGTDLDLPDLTGFDLAWDFSHFTTSGVIVIVPEPSRMLLLFAGVITLGFRRRRA